MITLAFEGWFQLRMATDPDPTDCPRGVSGYTFALPGEPDFDGVLHFQPGEPGVCEREFGDYHFAATPRVGVRVSSASRDGVEIPELVGAQVAMPGLRLEERNGIIVRDDHFAAHPVRVQVFHQGGVIVDREDWLDPAHAREHGRDIDISQASGDQIRRRQPAGFRKNSAEVAASVGLPDATDETLIKDREARREALEALRERTSGAAQLEALSSRIQELARVRQWWNTSAEDAAGQRPIDRRAYTRALQAFGWYIDVNGAVHENAPLIGGDPDLPWPVEFWLGGWDGDALCGYVKGAWCIPTRSRD